MTTDIFEANARAQRQRNQMEALAEAYSERIDDQITPADAYAEYMCCYLRIAAIDGDPGAALAQMQVEEDIRIYQGMLNRILQLEALEVTKHLFDADPTALELNHG